MCKYVGIDFEYSTGSNGSLHLICCALGDRCYWLNDYSERGSLLKAIEFYNNFGYKFVCHCLHLAEARCFIELGLNPMNYNWVDTWLLAKVFTNTSSNLNNVGNYSLADCIKHYLNIDIDTHEKEVCRNYCISGDLIVIEEHKDEIMQYCLHDIQYLIKLMDTIKSNHNNTNDLGMLTNSECAFANIASRGLPVNAKRMKTLLEYLPKFVWDEQMKLIDKAYLYTPAKPPKYRKKDGVKYSEGKPETLTLSRELVSKSLYEYLKENGYTFNETQATYYLKCKTCSFNGRPIEVKTDKDFLKQFSDGFPRELYEHKKLLNGINSFTKNYKPCGRLNYETLAPFGAKTGRCQPSPKNGFVPLLSKDFYCVLEPMPGKCLFEIDYSAQETFIQAAIYKDENMLSVYNSKDTYLWLLNKLGTISNTEFSTKSKDELKEKYAKERQHIKSVFLGWSYGAGANKIAQNAGIGVDKARKLLDFMNKTFIKTVEGRNEIVYNEDDVILSDGFRLVRGDNEKPTVIGNFPIQARGAQILRRLCINLENNEFTRGKCIATIHDAVVCECNENELELSKQAVLNIMLDSAKEVLGVDGIKASVSFELHNGEALFIDGHNKLEHLIEAKPVY